MYSFNEILNRAGITKAELSRRLGLNPRSISAWGDDPPKYAAAYLELLTSYNNAQGALIMINERFSLAPKKD